MKSPLGLPLPDVQIGRQHIPELSEMAREAGGSRPARATVEHLCPHCGGDTAAGLIVVQVCQLCGGRGRLSEEQMVRLFGPSGERALR